MPLALEVRFEGSVAVLSCRGPIVFPEATDLIVKARGLVASGRNLVINLAEVPRMDSIGVGALVGIYISAQNVKQTVVLAGLVPFVGQTLERAGLLNFLRAYEDESLAVQALQ